MKHKSVLLEEVIKYLDIHEDGCYADATLGYAGHSGEILKKLKKGFLFAFDQDSEAIEYSNTKLSSIGSNYKITKSNFIDMDKYVDKSLDGILFDLGVSSPQLDDETRGFSFHKDAKLDMRMDRDNPLTAEIVVNTYEYKDLVRIFFRYGDSKFSKQIASSIIKNRPIHTTLELDEIVKNSVPIKYRNTHHPSRKIFQAIRIEVNHELDILDESIKRAFELLKIGGRMCIITFHSEEDRVVSSALKDLCKDDEAAKRMPIVPEELKARAKVIVKLTPSESELEDNNRSRSSKLRVIERVR